MDKTGSNIYCLPHTFDGFVMIALINFLIFCFSHSLDIKLRGGTDIWQSCTAAFYNISYEELQEYNKI